jgi:hypothetical protein
MQKISNQKITGLWKQIHPRTKQPKVRAYLTSKRKLNKIADESRKGKGQFIQETKREYGKENAISSKTHNINGLVYKQGSTNVILIKKDKASKVNRFLKHELNHVFHNGRRK